MTNPLDICFEDDHLLVVNKPAGVLSQPGKTVDGSMATQIRDAYPHADGPMLVHRLDMDTSGLMVFAKTAGVHRDLQQQFEHRKISKRYTAVLTKSPDAVGGQISLPLRLDLENRPVQIVCFEHGKSAATLWTSVGGESTYQTDDARVYFTPITGRTHQLRVHAANIYGLNTPIVGDRLYGQEASRLMLHADRLGFWHPVTNERVQVISQAPF